jgi:hypothetical protein
MTDLREEEMKIEELRNKDYEWIKNECYKWLSDNTIFMEDGCKKTGWSVIQP